MTTLLGAPVLQTPQHDIEEIDEVLNRIRATLKPVLDTLLT